MSDGNYGFYGFPRPPNVKGDISVWNGTVWAILDPGPDGQVVTADSTQALGLKYAAAGGGSGTVTSVALTMPAEFSVAGSPITTNGTLAVTKANESANTVWAGPTSGGAAAPAFRALVNADVPTALTGHTWDSGQIGSSSPASGIFTTLNADSIAFKVLNNSGANANQNDLGYLDYDATNGYSYKTTTTANNDVEWCVVINGGGNGAQIYVARRGQVTVKLNANCSIGNFLLTSTTAGQASVSTFMRPEVFAVALSANSGGAGGTCTALLLCNTRFVPKTNANYIYSSETHSTTAFVATINGAPTTTSVVYNAPSSGADNVLVPGSGSPFVKQRLWNTTRNTFRLISSVNTGTKTITTVSSTDSWASGDTITIESQTVTTGQTFKAIELDLNQTVQTVIPLMARALQVQVLVEDTGTIATSLSSAGHPFETYAGSKLVGQNPTLANVVSYVIGPMPLINYVFTWLGIASGTATHYTYFRLNGWWEAAP